MFGKLISFVSIVLMFTLASTSYGIIIGDWEQNMDGWTAQNGATSSYSTIGVTLNNYSLDLDAPTGAFTWSLQHDGVLDLASNPILSIDVTWVAADWDDGGAGDIWVNLKEIAINSGGPSGWKQYVATDPMNPSYPGSWDPYSWGDVHTRTLTWDLSDYDATGATWMQIILSTNSGGTIVSGGNYYLDNAQLTPEPATIALLGLGGLALLRRKHS